MNGHLLRLAEGGMNADLLQPAPVQVRRTIAARWRTSAAPSPGHRNRRLWSRHPHEPRGRAIDGMEAGEAPHRPLDEVFSIINEETRDNVENQVAKVLR